MVEDGVTKVIDTSKVDLKTSPTITASIQKIDPSGRVSIKFSSVINDGKRLRILAKNSNSKTFKSSVDGKISNNSISVWMVDMDSKAITPVDNWNIISLASDQM